jgi:RHS repeat-associated protein
LSTGYGYTNGDLTSMVTPSRQTVTYTYTNHQVTAISINGTTLLSGVTYDPLGPPTGWTWGNSTTTSRSYTEDGVPNQIVTAGATNGYTEDNALRINGISDSGLSTNSWAFGYDLLDRVNSASSSALTRGYQYDANGNTTIQTGTVAYTSSISPTSNQVNSISGGLPRTYSYDAAGNTTAYIGFTYQYNDRGRLANIVQTAGTTSNIYNGLGQLIEIYGYGGTIVFAYDLAGHILGEYTVTGALIQETIWLGDLPVATLRPNGSSVSIYYVHADHLGTPRKVTRPSDNGLMWRWDPDTFGSVSPNQNPNSLGTFIYNLRFPGQYYRVESGLFYNYYRDYDPQTGRYLEADPIGLRGGINTYAYVSNAPLSWFDKFGLSGWLTVSSSGTSGLGNHSWITYTPDSGTTTTYGTWGNNPEGLPNGLETNLEQGRSADASRTEYLNDAQEAALMALIQNYRAMGEDAWTMSSPCSSFAANAWDSATGERLNTRWGPISNPTSLTNAIISANGGQANATLSSPQPKSSSSSQYGSNSSSSSSSSGSSLNSLGSSLN